MASLWNLRGEIDFCRDVYFIDYSISDVADIVWSILKSYLINALNNLWISHCYLQRELIKKVTLLGITVLDMGFERRQPGPQSATPVHPASSAEASVSVRGWKDRNWTVLDWLLNVGS